MLKRERKKVKKKEKTSTRALLQSLESDTCKRSTLQLITGSPHFKALAQCILITLCQSNLSFSLSFSLSCRPRSNPGRLPNACFLTFFCLIFTCFIYTVLWLQIFWLARNYRTHVSISCLFLSPVFIRSGRVSMVYVYIMNWYCMWALVKCCWSTIYFFFETFNLMLIKKTPQPSNSSLNFINLSIHLKNFIQKIFQNLQILSRR